MGGQRCACRNQACQNGSIKKMLEEANCQDLIKFRYIRNSPNPTRHKQRKQYAFRKCAEIYLQIPASQSTYAVHKYHWLSCMFGKNYDSTKLLNAVEIREIGEELTNKCGVTDNPLMKSQNQYGNLVGMLITGIQLSPTEKADLLSYVEAPVTSKANVEWFLCHVAPHRVSNWRNHGTKQLEDFTSPVAIMEDVSHAHAVGVAVPTSSPMENTSAPPELPMLLPEVTLLPILPQVLPSELPMSLPEVPLLPILPWVLFPKALEVHPEDKIGNGAPESPMCPIQPQILFSQQQECHTLQTFVQSQEDICSGLQNKYVMYSNSGCPTSLFIENNKVRLATQMIALAYESTEPVLLMSVAPIEKSQWLFLCCCGQIAGIGTNNQAKECCWACYMKQNRRQHQLENLERLTQPFSNTPIGTMSSPIKLDLINNLQREVLYMRKKLQELELRSAVNEDDENAKNTFKSVSNFFCSSRDDMIASIENMLTSQVKDTTTWEKISIFAKHTVNKICNYALVLQKKKNRLCFTPEVLKIALSLWMRSKKGYEVFKQQSITIMPSEALIKKVMQKMQVSEGKCARLFGWFHDTYVESEGEGKVSGHLMFDEMRLKNAMYWNCMTNELIGVSATHEGTNKILAKDKVLAWFLKVTTPSDNPLSHPFTDPHTDPFTDPSTNPSNIFIDDSPNVEAVHEECSEDEESPQRDLTISSLEEYTPVVYVNLWRLRTTTHKTQSSEFYFNTGRLNGAELIRQFLRVAGHYKMIGVRILGLLCDAAGQNERMYNMLRDDDVKYGRSGYPSLRNVTCKNPFDPERLIAMFHCSSHNVKSIRNQIHRSSFCGSRRLTINQVHFGWRQVRETYQRDKKRPLPKTKLRLPSVELDSYSVMCVAYAKAPFAIQTLTEMSIFVGDELECLAEVKQVLSDCACDIYNKVIPLLRSCVLATTAMSIKATINMLEYLSVAGAIYNDFLLNPNIKITPQNMDSYELQMKDLLQYFDNWLDDVKAKKTAEKLKGKEWQSLFLSPITLKILKTSLWGFFEYCRLCFTNNNPPKFVLVSHSNSSSIESVFAYVRNMRRDTPHGFITAMSALNSMDSITLLSDNGGRHTAYSSKDIPDEGSPSKTLIGRRDESRNNTVGNMLAAYKQRSQPEQMPTEDAATEPLGMLCPEDFGDSEVYWSFSKYVNKVAQDSIPDGFLHHLVNKGEFLETAKVAVLTTHKSWFDALFTVSPSDAAMFERACSLITSHLYILISKASRLRHEYYWRLVYKLLCDREKPKAEAGLPCHWLLICNALPDPLKEDHVSLALLIIHLADVVMDWVREALLQQQQQTKHDKDENDSTIATTVSDVSDYVHNFLGYAIIMLIRKLEKDYGENKYKIILLQSMLSNDEEDITVDPVNNLSAVSTNDIVLGDGRRRSFVSPSFFPFGKTLISELLKFTEESFKIYGTKAIEIESKAILTNNNLQDLFISCCKHGYVSDKTTSMGEDGLDGFDMLGDDDFIYLYRELCKRAFHAWAGVKSRRYNDQHTGRQAKDSINVTFRDDLNVRTRKKRKIDDVDD